MTNWSVQRISSPAPGATTLECLSNQQPVTVTLKDLDTGEISVISLCTQNDSTDVCDLLNQLKTAGYTPADWDTECE